MSKHNYPLTDYLNSINWTKENIAERGEDWMRQYPPYVINKCLSAFIDTIIYSNEMNVNHHIDKDMQYSFYLNTVRPKRRFSPWGKKQQVKDLDLVKKYFKYNDDKARDALRILTKDQIELIKSKLNTGGMK